MNRRGPRLVKDLYRGMFTFGRQLYVERCYAYSARQAWLLMCKRLARKKGVDPTLVVHRFDGSKDNFLVTVEMEFKECGD